MKRKLPIEVITSPRCIISAPFTSGSDMVIEFTLHSTAGILNFNRIVNSMLSDMFRESLNLLTRGGLNNQLKKVTEDLLECGIIAENLGVATIASHSHLEYSSKCVYWFGRNQGQYGTAYIRFDIFLYAVVVAHHTGRIGNLVFTFSSELLPGGGGVISSTENFLRGTSIEKVASAVISGEDTFI